jgi:hypothetical protein
MEQMTSPEKKAAAWDRFVTVIIVLLLFFPLPFARFQTQPQKVVLLERPILPWSQFRIRYVTYPRGVPVEQVYRFTWNGKIVAQDVAATPAQTSVSFAITPVNNPLLRWQNNPEIRLGDIFVQGEVLKVTSFWQPLLFWPLRIGWQARVS